MTERERRILEQAKAHLFTATRQLQAAQRELEEVDLGDHGLVAVLLGNLTTTVHNIHDRIGINDKPTS